MFAFSAFARIEELVSTKDHKEVQVLQLDDISFTYNSEGVHQVHVSYRFFKHHYSGPPKVVSFSHGETKLSAVKALTEFLQHRHKNSGQLFC